ncbi:MAG: hypothetical protein ACKVQA_05455 [Burkholderiales bacterium]
MTHRGSLSLNIARFLLACGILLSVCAYGRDFPPDARRGEVKEFNYPRVKIGKTVYHIPPGGKIFNEHNLIIMPVAMPATAQVMYRLDFSGQIRSMWLLTPEEIKKLGRAPR